MIDSAVPGPATLSLDIGVSAVVTCGMQSTHPLKAFRERHEPKLSQAALAETLGVNRLAVVRWETGVRKIDKSKLSDVSSKTGIPTKELRPDLAELMGAAQ
jgi:DNA-binding XRE family transcriptional regulator